MGGFYVFPGGAVHESDYSPTMLARCRGLSGDDARAILGDRHDPQIALGHWVAAVRELFEEVGILLCVTESGEDIDARVQTVKQRLELKRQAIIQGQLGFGSLLESEGLYCDLSRQTYFFHRITPELYPIRFDARFYLAPLPPHQEALVRSEEVDESLWITPTEALRRANRHDFPLVPPTTTVLKELSQIDSWQVLEERYGL